MTENQTYGNGWGNEQEAGAVVVQEPVGEGGEVPEFLAEFEEAVFMEGSATALVVGWDGLAKPARISWSRPVR